MSMSLLEMRAPLRPSDPVLIFVHGFLSDSDSCWRNGNGVSWPEIVKRDQNFPPCGISTFSYESKLTGRRYSITDAADLLWEQLKDKGLLTPDRPLVFVCHSMGGIVVRRLLVKQQVEFARSGAGSVGLFLVASPTMGSRWASWLRPVSELMRHDQGMALSSQENNTWLHELRQDFVKLTDNGPLKIFGKELIEAEPVAFRWIPWLPPVVRSIEGAILFADPVKVAGSDHFSVAKPVHEAAIQNVALRNFVRDLRRQSSGGNYTIPKGLSFGQAAELVARSRSLDVDLSAFSDGERAVQSTFDRVIEFTSVEDAFERLALAFPLGSIRPYTAMIRRTTIVVSLKEVVS